MDAELNRIETASYCRLRAVHFGALRNNTKTLRSVKEYNAESKIEPWCLRAMGHLWYSLYA